MFIREVRTDNNLRTVKNVPLLRDVLQSKDLEILESFNTKVKINRKTARRKEKKKYV